MQRLIVKVLINTFYSVQAKNNVALLIVTTKTAIQNGLLAHILACLQCD